jgi:hypothetical protein
MVRPVLFFSQHGRDKRRARIVPARAPADCRRALAPDRKFAQELELAVRRRSGRGERIRSGVLGRALLAAARAEECSRTPVLPRVWRSGSDRARDQTLCNRLAHRDGTVRAIPPSFPLSYPPSGFSVDPKLDPALPASPQRALGFSTAADTARRHA